VSRQQIARTTVSVQYTFMQVTKQKSQHADAEVARHASRWTHWFFIAAEV